MRQISKPNFVAGLKSVLGLSVPWANADALWDRIVRCENFVQGVLSVLDFCLC